ncbi:2-amino-4-hydroxy-6-hydroxymethyldihydropteridine diphosphokinase [Tamilnaduibacter salinus]|uniref:2-amino-4-hydroxy-6-hydroxymethyldihydropteridine pyrophosphokinase n=1 Tax=Tamilnaduibacter salinus TaxID=1484056 RepID=A0A2U1CYM9_9GAMM|nr:2-amino-4-hydroxy-6-hydroxymethyldihydropteridine diphosphokinase [Tamilnaduibacter salinus]PVY77602.1 2-amino-4-hydroxy-6-hydroxymethyldihydropteridine diphosphokinase [Tamilnaduibacter salinus]
MRYLCGVGSNIRPEDNIPAAFGAMADRFGTLHVSCVIRTRPDGIATPRHFLNALVTFESDESPQALKEWLNSLEESLGRDRSDPLSSVKDRPLDVDILEHRQSGRFTGNGIDEPYFQPLLSDNPVGATPLHLDRQVLGEAPATIHRDQGAGHEVVIHHRQKLGDYGFKAAFPGQ